MIFIISGYTFIFIISIFLLAQKNESKKGHPVLLPFGFSPGSTAKRDLRNSLSLKQVANLALFPANPSDKSKGVIRQPTFCPLTSVFCFLPDT